MKKRFSKFFGTRQFYKLALAVAVPVDDAAADHQLG